MLQDYQPPKNQQLWRSVTAVVLCRPIYVSVKSVTTWSYDELTLWRDELKPDERCLVKL